MKLDYTYGLIKEILTGEKDECQDEIIAIAYDTRRIISGKNVLFFAIEGTFRDGHDYIDEAYQKGVRHFVVTKKSV